MQLTNKDILLETKTLYKAHHNNHGLVGRDAGLGFTMLSLAPRGLPRVALSSLFEAADDDPFVKIEESS